jgi:hypothetical protein
LGFFVKLFFVTKKKKKIIHRFGVQVLANEYLFGAVFCEDEFLIK